MNYAHCVNAKSKIEGSSFFFIKKENREEFVHTLYIHTLYNLQLPLSRMLRGNLHVRSQFACAMSLFHTFSRISLDV